VIDAPGRTIVTPPVLACVARGGDDLLELTLLAVDTAAPVTLELECSGDRPPMGEKMPTGGTCFLTNRVKSGSGSCAASAPIA
jgi:hypothetical protein